MVASGDTKPPMMLRQFMAGLPDIVRIVVREQCETELDERNFRNFTLRFVAHFDKPTRKKIMDLLAIKPDIDQKEFVQAIFDQLNNRGQALYMPCEPGDLTKEGIMKNAGLTLVQVVCSQIIGVQPPNNETGIAPEPFLLQEIDTLVQIKGSLTADEKGNYFIDEQHKTQIRHMLAESVIDADFLFRALENKKLPGQYL